MTAFFAQDRRAVTEEIDGRLYITNAHWMLALTHDTPVPPIKEMKPYRAAIKGKELQYIGTDSDGDAVWREKGKRFVVILDARYVELLGLRGKTLRATGNDQPVAFFDGDEHLGWIMPRRSTGQFSLDGLLAATEGGTR